MQEFNRKNNTTFLSHKKDHSNEKWKTLFEILSYAAIRIFCVEPSRDFRKGINCTRLIFILEK